MQRYITLMYVDDFTTSSSGYIRFLRVTCNDLRRAVGRETARELAGQKNRSFHILGISERLPLVKSQNIWKTWSGSGCRA